MSYDSCPATLTFAFTRNGNPDFVAIISEILPWIGFSFRVFTSSANSSFKEGNFFTKRFNCFSKKAVVSTL